MNGHTFSEWFATGVMLLTIAIVAGTLVYCVKRKGGDAGQQE